MKKYWTRQIEFFKKTDMLNHLDFVSHSGSGINRMSCVFDDERGKFLNYLSKRYSSTNGVEEKRMIDVRELFEWDLLKALQNNEKSDDAKGGGLDDVMKLRHNYTGLMYLENIGFFEELEDINKLDDQSIKEITKKPQTPHLKSPFNEKKPIESALEKKFRTHIELFDQKNSPKKLVSNKVNSLKNSNNSS